MNNISYDTPINNSDLILKINNASQLLKLLSEENRVNILTTLLPDTRCVSEIVSLTKLSQSLVSHHLRDLKYAGLVTGTRSGKWVFYAITDKGNNTLQLITSL